MFTSIKSTMTDMSYIIRHINAFQIDTFEKDKLWNTFQKWGKLY